MPRLPKEVQRKSLDSVNTCVNGIPRLLQCGPLLAETHASCVCGAETIKLSPLYQMFNEVRTLDLALKWSFWREQSVLHTCATAWNGFGAKPKSIFTKAQKSPMRTVYMKWVSSFLVDSDWNVGGQHVLSSTNNLAFFLFSFAVLWSTPKALSFVTILPVWKLSLEFPGVKSPHRAIPLI